MKKALFVFLVSLFFFQCSRNYSPQAVSSANAYLSDSSASDSSVARIIAPYKEKMDARLEMGLVTTAIDLENKRPEGSLGNFVADALLHQASLIQPDRVDIAITNITGLRIPKIPAGIIRLRHVYELIPFENKVVVTTVSGATLAGIFDRIVEREGDCISFGSKIYSYDDTTIQYIVNNLNLDLDKSYTVATTDFLYQGGDGFNFKNSPVTKSDLTLRQAVINEMKDISAQLKTIEYINNGRILLPQKKVH